MGTTITCADCAADFDSKDGFLRPEGFLCGACYRERCKDPAYVAEMERQLTELVSTIAVSTRMDSEGPTGHNEPPLAPQSVGERIACASLVGLSVGDALGAAREGAPFDLAEADRPLAPEGLARWTDDTQMALGLVEALLELGRIDQDRLAAAFAKRYEPWRGYGPSMHVVLPRIRSGEDWRALKDAVFRGGSFGNGSAMRVAPLGAYYHQSPVDTVVSEAERSAEVTHAHPEALAGAAGTALASWLAARSRGRPVPTFDELFSAVQAPLDPSLRVSRGLARARELGASADLGTAVKALGNGSQISCPDTVPLALWIAFRCLDDYRAAIGHAIAAGGDTDTVAAIVGGIVAARVGMDGIPQDWRQAVEPVPVDSE